MSNLTKRLRATVAISGCEENPAIAESQIIEAANEIDRLKAELEQVKTNHAELVRACENPDLEPTMAPDGWLTKRGVAMKKVAAALAKLQGKLPNEQR